MDCKQLIPDDNAAFLKRFHHKMSANRIPLSGSIDLTRKCNFQCVHCYHGTPHPETGDPNAELSTAQWLSIIDQIAEAGCLFLLISGGDPLFRPDFPDLYAHAVNKGMLVTVFCNGALINDSIIQLFQEFPPYEVEITLYGATPATYKRITGSASNYDAAISGIQKLNANGIRFKLKTMLMTPNFHEFSAIQDIAQEYRVSFRFDAALFGRLNGDKTPIGYRITPETAVELEMADAQTINGWLEFYQRMKDSPLQDTVYHCGAGITNFHIDPSGNLQPCTMTTRLQYNVLGPGGFQDGWRRVMPQIRNEKASGDILVCNTCHKRFLCAYCPAFFELENGSTKIRSEFLCAQAGYRYKALFENAIQEGTPGTCS